jgi:hypothetical protein
VAAKNAARAIDDPSLELDDDEDVVFFDPFAQPQLHAAGEPPDVSPLRLAGLLRDRTRALALLEMPEGSATVEKGQQFGAERVAKLDALGVTLVDNGGVTRTLALTEAS